MALKDLRDKLDGIDREILRLIGARQEVISDIAAVKQSTGSSLRDFRREREVLDRAAAFAVSIGISPDVADDVMRTLIRYSLTMQEQSGISAHGRGHGRRALVIGGAGNMGNWFAQFLDSQGFDVEISDVPGNGSTLPQLDWRTSKLDHHYIVVATPMGSINDILLELAAKRPSGVVFDLASLKTPLRSGLAALKAAGVQVASLHPMFGPDVELLAGHRVVFIDVGCDDALQKARTLFEQTMVSQVVLGLDEHDKFMSCVLGLPHALNIAFFTALESFGQPAARLMEVSGTTFVSQFDVCRRVAHENPSLYYEIQKLNAFGMDSLAALSAAVEKVRNAVDSGNAEAFVKLMSTGRSYTSNRRGTRGSR